MIITITSKSEHYHNYKDEMIRCYIEAFYTGQGNTVLKSNIAKYFDQLMADGFGLISVVDEKLNGVLIATPAAYTPYLPEEILQTINVEKSLYIAEVFVSEKSRGMGYGKQLFDAFFKLSKKDTQHLVIRVLRDNTRAINLYQSFGFEIKATIVERKTDFNNNHTTLDKLYLIKGK